MANKLSVIRARRLARNTRMTRAEFKLHRTVSWTIWSIGTSFVLFQFITQLCYGEMANDIMHAFSTTALGVGILGGAYYYIYVSLQLPAGILIDRFGPRRLLLMGAIVTSIGALIFASASELWEAIFGRVMMGGGAAFAFVGTLSLTAEWFPLSRFAQMTSFLESLGMLGAVVGGLSIAAVVQWINWRVALYGFAVIAAIIALLVWAFVINSPRRTLEEMSHDVPEPNVLRDLKVLMKNKIAWMNAIYSGLIYAPVTVFVSLWSVPFFQLEHPHLSLIEISLLSNLTLVGLSIGCPLMSWLDKRVTHRRLLLEGCAVATGMILLLVIYVPAVPVIVDGLLMFLLGFPIAAYLLTFVIGNEIMPAYMRSTSIGFVNTLSVGSAPIFQGITGLILSLLASSEAVGLHHEYTLHQYHIALAIMPILGFLAFFCARYLPNRLVQVETTSNEEE